LNNEASVKSLVDEAYQLKVAASIAAGIEKFAAAAAGARGQ
jgi:hypothetical protein